MTSCLNPPWLPNYDKDHPPPPPDTHSFSGFVPKPLPHPTTVAGLSVVHRSDLPSMFDILGKNGCWSARDFKAECEAQHPRGLSRPKPGADVVAGLKLVARADLPTMFDILAWDEGFVAPSWTKPSYAATAAAEPSPGLSPEANTTWSCGHSEYRESYDNIAGFGTLPTPAPPPLPPPPTQRSVVPPPADSSCPSPALQQAANAAEKAKAASSASSAAALAALEVLKATLLGLKKDDLAELLKLCHPPESINSVFEAVGAILDVKPDKKAKKGDAVNHVNAAKKHFGKCEDLLSAFTACDAGKPLDAARASRLASVLARPDFNEETTAKAHRVGPTIVSWVKAFARYQVARGVATAVEEPKKAAAAAPKASPKAKKPEEPKAGNIKAPVLPGDPEEGDRGVLEAYLVALKSVKRNDLNEIFMFAKPPDMLQVTFDAVCAVFDINSDKKAKKGEAVNHVNNAKKHFGKTDDFLRALLEFDPSKPMSVANEQRLAVILSKELFNVAHMKNISKAGSALCAWCHTLSKLRTVVKRLESKVAAAPAQQQQQQTAAAAKQPEPTPPAKEEKKQVEAPAAAAAKEEKKTDVAAPAARARAKARAKKAVAEKDDEWVMIESPKVPSAAELKAVKDEEEQMRAKIVTVYRSNPKYMKKIKIKYFDLIPIAGLSSSASGKTPSGKKTQQ